MLYAYILEGAIKDSRDFAEPPPDMTRKGAKWIPYVDTDPPFDPATQVKSGPAVTILDRSVTRVWAVRDKTAQELDEDKEANVASKFNFLLFELAFDHESRLRVLEAKPAITRLQFRNALKARLP